MYVRREAYEGKRRLEDYGGLGLLVNREVFVWAFLEMIFWFWVSRPDIEDGLGSAGGRYTNADIHYVRITPQCETRVAKQRN